MLNPLITPKLADWIRQKLTPLSEKIMTWGVHAHQLTWTGVGASFIAGLLCLKGYFFIAGLFAGLTGLMGILDGMVARSTQTTSQAEALLHSVAHHYADFFLLMGLIARYKSFFLNFYLGFFALMGSFMMSYAHAKAKSLQVEMPAGFMQRPDRWAILTGALLLSSLRFLGHIPMFLALITIAVGANMVAISQLKKLVQSLRSLTGE